ncbi:unnamed protein product [Brachionus calyciflorus]|uniref:Thioredoxin domain-containing protein n=1 Tax=Brachionus calyciflorus TaxID=104777 RepID=A0A814BKQ0_9BILA|nr:unnamed protein product [Brachionus calyciflorus]
MLSYCLIIFLVSFKIKYSLSDNRCPFPRCKTIYKYIDYPSCNVLCPNINLNNQGQSKIKAIDILELYKVSSFSDDIFSDLEIQSLTFYYNITKNIAANTFRKVSLINRFYLEKLDINQFFYLNENFVHLKSRISLFYVKNCFNFNENNFKKILESINSMEINQLFLNSLDFSPSEIDLSTYKYPNSISIRQFQATKVIISISEYLTIFELAKTNIKEIFVGSRNRSLLQELNLEDNQIEKLTILNLFNLKKLYLKNNKLKFLNYKQNELKNLEYLNLNDNQINSIEQIFFINLTNLSELYLSNNKLDENIKLNYLYKLIKLDISSNKFKTFSNDLIPHSLRLEYLDLSNNQIVFVNINISSLLYLDLSGNKIKTLANLRTIYLNHLIISNNLIDSIEDIDPQLANSLLTFEISQNLIRSISFGILSRFVNLVRLELDNNFMEKIQFPELSKLESLFLNENKISTIEKKTFELLKNIQILSLSSNAIRSIEYECFSQNSKLRILFLNTNLIRVIPDFSYMNNLEQINLNNNLITFLNAYSFERVWNEKRIEYLLSGNKITYFSPHVFCSKNGLGEMGINIDGIDNINKCMLKQFDQKVEINIFYHHLDCYLQTFVDFYHLKIDSSYKKSNCSTYKFINDCHNEANLKYNCSFGLENFDKESIWILNESLIFSSEKKFQKCSIYNSSYILFKNEYYEIRTNINNTSFILKFGIYEKDLNLVEDSKYFGYLELKPFSKLLYHFESDSYIITGFNTEWVGIMASRFLLNKSMGLLKSGCEKSMFLDYDNSNMLNTNDMMNSFIMNDTRIKSAYLNLSKAIILIEMYENDRNKNYSEKLHINKMSVIHVNESAKFKELISSGVSLVDFSATWCGPCKRIEPHFKDLAKENPNVNFIHIDVDEASETMPNELSHVSGVPHFELYHNGEKISQFAGANLDRIKEGVALLKSKLIAPKEVEEKKKEEPEEEAKEKTPEEEAKDKKPEENKAEPLNEEKKTQEEKEEKTD